MRPNRPHHHHRSREVGVLLQDETARRTLIPEANRTALATDDALPVEAQPDRMTTQIHLPAPHQNPAASPPRRFTATAAALVAAAVLVVTGCGSASTAEAPRPTEPGDSIVDRGSLQTELDDLVVLGVPGVVVMVRDDDQSVVLTAGVSDLEAGTQMSADAKFRIASLTKPYVASVVLQLVAEGTLGLDDTVQQWLPGIVTGADRISIRQLLGHTSGVADYFNDPAVLEPYLAGDYEYVWTPQQLIEIAEQLGATSEPGTEWSYSNTNYAIAGLMVEQATGRTLGEEMQTRIFDALGLENTTFAIDTDLDPQMAHGYLMDGGDSIDVSGVYPFPWGAGNIVSDAADTATFYGALLGGEVVEPALLDEMMPVIADDVEPYGLGLMAWEMSCGVAYGHDGGFAGYSTRSLVLDDGRQVVILSNSITTDDHVAADPAADAQYDALIDAAMCG